MTWLAGRRYPQVRGYKCGNRYYIAKKLYMNYLVIIVRKGKYVSCGIDALIIKTFKEECEY